MPARRQFSSNEEYNKWYRNYREKMGEKYRSYQRKYNQKRRKEIGYEIEMRSMARYPMKQWARRILANAVRQGMIIRQPCVVCGKPKGQAHHDDYNKPLDVRWFCPLHHRQNHPHPSDEGVDKLPLTSVPEGV